MVDMKNSIHMDDDMDIIKLKKLSNLESFFNYYSIVTISTTGISFPSL